MRFVQGDPLADRCLSIIDLLMPTTEEVTANNDMIFLDIFQGNPVFTPDLVRDM